MTTINYASSGVNKLGASLSDDARVVIYDRRMFVVQTTGLEGIKSYLKTPLYKHLALLDAFQ